MYTTVSPLTMEVLLFALTKRYTINLLSIPCSKCLQVRSLRVEVLGVAYAHMQSNSATSFFQGRDPIALPSVILGIGKPLISIRQV